MRKNSILVLVISGMATVLMAGRCSDDDEAKPAVEDSSSTEMPSATDEAVNAADPKSDMLDSGVETDPLGGTMDAGGDDMAAPVEDPADVPADDSSLDDPTFEPEPVPEEAADL